MAAGDIRVGWNPSTGCLIALHPDDGTYGRGIAAFRPVDPAELPEEMAARAEGMLVGPTLSEITAMMQETGT